MIAAQAGILLPPPEQARYLFFSLGDTGRLQECLPALRAALDGESAVVGFGSPLVAALGKKISGLKSFPLTTAPGYAIEKAPEALWIWLRGGDRGEILLRSQHLTQLAAPAFTLREIWDAFKYRDGRDLSGFEDGTENPTGEEAVAAAIVHDASPLAGSSFVATQRWRHDFERLATMSRDAQNNAIGRRLADNEELADAPVSAHVKRTAQESFTPEAFVLRRSLPWASGNEGGLMFVAFGRSFAAFEAQLGRMVGAEDGVVDALFGFTQPLAGAYFWCPPCKDGQLDFSPLGV